MDDPTIFTTISALVRKAPENWLKSICQIMRSGPEHASESDLLTQIPATVNGDIAFLVATVIKQAHGKMTWEALGWAIEAYAAAYDHSQKQQRVELLWAGPSPAANVQARRIDQMLYDKIASAKHDILLITFAAYKVGRLIEGLTDAITRNVQVRLILEFETESQYQLSQDALKAFPADFQNKSLIYYWPLEKRKKNSFGNPGKLHAKGAVIDDCAMLFSANLTDDAFNRNLELGTLFEGGEMPKQLRNHFDGLINGGTLARWRI
jgi:cardiolipin synthase